MVTKFYNGKKNEWVNLTKESRQFRASGKSEKFFDVLGVMNIFLGLL